MTGPRPTSWRGNHQSIEELTTSVEELEEIARTGDQDPACYLEGWTELGDLLAGAQWIATNNWTGFDPGAVAALRARAKRAGMEAGARLRTPERRNVLAEASRRGLLYHTRVESLWPVQEMHEAAGGVDTVVLYTRQNDPLVTATVVAHGKFRPGGWAVVQGDTRFVAGVKGLPHSRNGDVLALRLQGLPAALGETIVQLWEPGTTGPLGRATTLVETVLALHPDWAHLDATRIVPVQD